MYRVKSIALGYSLAAIVAAGTFAAVRNGTLESLGLWIGSLTGLGAWVAFHAARFREWRPPIGVCSLSTILAIAARAGALYVQDQEILGNGDDFLRVAERLVAEQRQAQREVRAAMPLPGIRSAVAWKDPASGTEAVEFTFDSRPRRGFVVVVGSGLAPPPSFRRGERCVHSIRHPFYRLGGCD